MTLQANNEAAQRYFRSEQYDNGFVIECVVDNFNEENLVKRTIDRYAFSEQKVSSACMQALINHFNGSLLHSICELHTNIEINSNCKPKTSVAISEEERLEEGYRYFSAKINGSSVGTFPVRTCTKEFGVGKKKITIIDTDRAINLTDDLIHGKIGDEELRRMHQTVLQQYPFREGDVPGVGFLLRSYRDFNGFKAAVSGFETFGIIDKESYLMNHPVNISGCPCM